MGNGLASQIQFRNQNPPDKIYRVGPVGSQMLFTSIQAAINQAIADGFGGGSQANIELLPGVYTENLNLFPGINLIGTLGGFQDAMAVSIVGDHALIKSVAGAFRAENIYFNAFLTSVNPLLSVSGAGSGDVSFDNCHFLKRWNGSSALYLDTTVGITYSICLNNCGANVNLDAGAVFDLSAATGSPSLKISGQVAVGNAPGYSISASSLSSTPSVPFYITPIGGTVSTINNVRINANSKRVFAFSSPCFLEIYNSQITPAFANGEVFKFLSNGQVQLSQVFCSISGVGGEVGFPAVARDGGNQAVGVVGMITNLNPGDTVVVNGNTWTAVAGAPAFSQFQIGATKEDTAFNLATALTTEGNSLVPAFMGVTFTGLSTVDVTAFATGLAGNAITLATNAPARISLSGATLAGGTNGSGGSIQYAACGFGFNSYQTSLSVGALNATIQPKS